MRRAFAIIYFIVLTMGITSMVCGIIWGKTNVYNRNQNAATTQLFPAEKVEVTEDITEYYFELDNTGENSMAVDIYSAHQTIKVYADGELIYSLEEPDSAWGTTSGANYNFVQIPVGTKDLKIVSEAIYEEERDRDMEFYIGDIIGMYRAHLKEAFPSVVISLLSICMGVFLIAFWLLVKHKLFLGLESFYFGLFSLLLGTWTLQETSFATILVSNRTVASYCGYMLLMLGVIPFILFVKDYMEVDDKWWYLVLCGLSITVTVVNTTGHMLRLWYFKKTVILVHICLALAVGYLVYGIFKRIRRLGVDQKVRLNIIGAGVLILAIITDTSAYYLNFRQTDLIGRIGLLVYTFLLGTHTMREFFIKIDEGRKAEIYKELAEHDAMTGLYNRNAFDEWESARAGFENVMLVTFDLNNLKKCNDTMGHAAGDKYIIDAAKLIQQVFGKAGKCYRIGGDEFCAVVEQGERFNVDWHTEQLRRVQEAYNKDSKDIQMYIACGHAMFEEADLNIEETRSRADARMYTNKKESKQS